MIRRAILVLAAGSCFMWAGCHTGNGHEPPCPPDKDPKAAPIHITHDVYRRVSPLGPRYGVVDRTHVGLSPGDEWALRTEVIDRLGNIYALSAKYGAPSSGNLQRYRALVGPSPEAINTELASACFDANSPLVFKVANGWQYVSGDMPITDTGVVQTSSFGNNAPGAWIGRIVPSGGGTTMIYNVGARGSAKPTCTITVPGALLIPSGPLPLLDCKQVLTVVEEPSPGTTQKQYRWDIRSYDPNDSFLVEVKRIAASAGLTVTP